MKKAPSPPGYVSFSIYFFVVFFAAPMARGASLVNGWCLFFILLRFLCFAIAALLAFSHDRLLSARLVDHRRTLIKHPHRSFVGGRTLRRGSLHDAAAYKAMRHRSVIRAAWSGLTKPVCKDGCHGQSAHKFEAICCRSNIEAKASVLFEFTCPEGCLLITPIFDDRKCNSS